MQRAILFAAVLLCGTGPIQGQVPLGLAHNWEATSPDGTSFFSRAGLGNAAGVILNRYDHEDLRFAGVDGGGTIELVGWNVVLQDLDGSTPETFRFVFHLEDPNRPDFPAAVPIAQSVAIKLRPSAAQPLRIFATATFGPPLRVAPGQDLFAGVELSAATATDGLAVAMVSASPLGGATVFDVPGPAGLPGAAIPQDTYVCVIPAGQAPSYGPDTLQLRLELMLPREAVGGMPLTRTAQASYAPGNAPLGTTDLLSGLHPDIARGDDIGFVARVDTGVLPVGTPVAFLMALAPATLPVPLAHLPLSAAPGTRGVLGIDPAQAAVFLGFVGVSPNPVVPGGPLAEGEAVVHIDMNAARGVVAALPGPLEVWWQAVALAPGAAGPPFDVRASGLVVQRLKP